MSQQPANPLSAGELVANARRLVEAAASASSREHDTIATLEARVAWMNRADVVLAIRALLNTLGDLGSCRGCGATIWWVQTKRSRLAPYSIAAINHFADCPKARSFRRGAGQ